MPPGQEASASSHEDRCTMTVETKAKPSPRRTHGKKNGKPLEGDGGSPSPSSEEHQLLAKREMLAALRAFERGDFNASLPDDHTGIDGELCAVFNEIVARAAELDTEIASVSTEFVSRGATHRRLRGARLRGGWERCADGVNATLDTLMRHNEAITSVVRAVSTGDLDKRVVVVDAPHARGEFFEQATAVNTMVDTLKVLGDELTRVAQEVGIDGKLGAQAHVPGVRGAWRDLTSNVNLMASNLTSQVREIARVTTAVARGDLTKTVRIGEWRGARAEEDHQPHGGPALQLCR